MYIPYTWAENDLTPASEQDLEKNEKKSDLSKEILIETSKKELLEKQLETANKVMAKVSGIVDHIFKQLGVPKSHEKRSNGNPPLQYSPIYTHIPDKSY